MPQKFKVVDHDNDNEKTFSSRSQAEEKADIMRNDFHADVSVEPVKEQAQADDTQVVENNEAEQEPPQPSQDDLPDEPSIQDDPVDWLPSHFIDQIQGVPTVNRKGYAVIASKYDLSVTSEPVTLPSESDFEYAEFKAKATTADGQEFTGFGSAHIERQDGDDPHLLGELAETRAMKRATAWASGVGLTAMSEMQGSL